MSLVAQPAQPTFEQHETKEPRLVDPDFASLEPAPPRRRINRLAIGVAVLVLTAIGIGWYVHAQGFEETDDAQVDGHINPITSRIDGTVTAVLVDDNQAVVEGKLLIELDPRDHEVDLNEAEGHVDQALAQLGGSHPNLPITRISNQTELVSQQSEVTNAEAALEAARHHLDSSIAKVKESQATNERSQADFLRYQTLYEKKEVARAQYDQYRATSAAQAQIVAANQAAVASAQKVIEQRQAQLEQQHSKLLQAGDSAPLQVAIRQADIESQRANVEAMQAVVERVRLALAYSNISAPVTGVVTQRSAEVGARISAGQQLMMVVQTNDLCVTANFKETQLNRMHPNQPVRIYVDALGETFDGTVESMPAVTGSRTSVLPPENATGNYVKVIQRLPVRIRFSPSQKDLDKLRPGMSVEPKVRLN